jgi:hypothetical protein
MYPWMLWELVADPLGSAEHSLGTTAPKLFGRSVILQVEAA